MSEKQIRENLWGRVRKRKGGIRSDINTITDLAHGVVNHGKTTEEGNVRLLFSNNHFVQNRGHTCL